MESFGKNLKEARKIRRMNQQALGDAVGVGQTTIANYEKGARFPTGELLRKLAEILNVSIDELMGHQVLPMETTDMTVDIEGFRQKLVSALLNGEEQEAIVMIWSLKPDAGNLLFIYEEVLMKAMITIGDMWASGRVGVAVEHFASHVVHKIIAMLSTIPAEMPKRGGKAVCISLGDETHTIGIKMISEFLNLRGIQSFYIGAQVPVDSLIELLLKKKAGILAVSATMSDHLEDLGTLTKLIRRNPKLNDLKIILGGQALINSHVSSVPHVNGYCTSFNDLDQWLYRNDFIESIDNAS